MNKNRYKVFAILSSLLIATTMTIQADNSKTQVYFSSDKTTINQGYVIKPTLYELDETLSADQLIKSSLSDNQIAYKVNNQDQIISLFNIDNGSSLEKSLPASLNNENVKEHLTFENEEKPNLGDNSYSSKSNWSILVNNKLVEKDYVLKNNDVLTLEFELTKKKSIIENEVDKSDLIKKIALINSDKKAFLNDTNLNEYDNANDVLLNYDASSVQVMNAVAKLESIILNNKQANEKKVETINDDKIDNQNKVKDVDKQVNDVVEKSNKTSENKQIQKAEQSDIKTKNEVEKIKQSTNVLTDWSGYGGNDYNNKVYFDKLPKYKNDIQAKTILSSNEYMKDPLIINDKIYVVDGSNLLELDKDGNKSKSIKVNTGYFSKIVYGNGMIFVPSENDKGAYIEAIKIKENGFESVWKSPLVKDGQMLSAINYYNGYIYTGVSIPEGGSSTPTKGLFFALNVNGKVEKGILNYAWTYQKSGYYWVDSVIANGAVIFAGDDGVLVSHSLYSDEIYDSLQLGDKHDLNKVRSTLLYNKGENAIIVGTQDSKKLYKVYLNNQKFKRDNIKQSQQLNQISGGIAYSPIQKHYYVSSGGQNGKGFFVLDENFEVIKRFDNINTQSIPLVVEGSEDNGTTYIYILCNDDKGELKIIADNEYDISLISSFKMGEMKDHNASSVIPCGNKMLFQSNNKLIVLENTPGTKASSKHSEEGIKSLINRTKEIFENVLNFDYFNDFIVMLNQYQEYSKLDEVIKVNEFYNYSKQQQVKNAQDIYDQINNLSKDDYEKAKELLSKYNQIPQSIRTNDQAMMAKLASIIDTDDQVRKFTNLINSISDGMIQESDGSTIEQLEKIYQGFDKTQLSAVEKYHDKYQHLLSEKNKLIEAKEYLEIINAIEKLNTVDKISLKEYDHIKNLVSTYSKLSIATRNSANKMMIKKLNDAYIHLQEQKKLVDKINAEIVKIDPLAIKLSDKTTVDKVMKLYQNVDVQNQAYVSWYDTVVDASKKIGLMQLNQKINNSKQASKIIKNNKNQTVIASKNTQDDKMSSDSQETSAPSLGGGIALTKSKGGGNVIKKALTKKKAPALSNNSLDTNNYIENGYYQSDNYSNYKKAAISALGIISLATIVFISRKFKDE